MIAQHVANVLAQETLDALAKFLDPFDILLLHVPAAVGVVGFARFERLDFFLDAIIPGDVGDQIFDQRESLHRFDR